jgi:hypothetical protein
MAVADAGPFLVTDINKFKEYTPHQPADDLKTGNQYLVDNAIYKWTGVDVTYNRLPYQTLIPGYDSEVAIRQSREDVAGCEKIGILDPATFTVESVLGQSEEGVFLLDGAVWPVKYDIQEVVLSGAGADFADLITSGTSAVVYIVAPPYNTNLYGTYPSDEGFQYVYITDTASKATAVLTAALAVGGTAFMASGVAEANGAYVVASPSGSTASITYGVPEWNWPVNINGQISNLLQNLYDGPQSVNTLHLPGTLQSPTREYRLNFVSRTLLDPSARINSCLLPGSSTQYASIEIKEHKLVNGQKVFFTQPVSTGSSTLFKATTVNSLNPYFVKVLDNDNIVLASSTAGYLSGSFVTFPTNPVCTTPTILYSGVLGGDLTSVNLSELITVPFIRARKYGINSGLIANQAANAANNPSVNVGNPNVSLYLIRSS